MTLRPVARVLLGHGLGNWVAVLAGFGYLGILAPQLDAQTVAWPVFWWAVATSLGVNVGVVWLLLRLARPVGLLLEAAAQGAEVPERLAAEGRRRALSLPLVFGAISVLVWLASAALYVPFHFAWGLPREVAAHIVVFCLSMTVIGSTLAHYNVERVVRDVVLPALPPGGRAVPAGVLQISLRGKLILLVVSAAVVPMLLVTALQLSALSTAAGTVYVGAVFVGLGVLQGRAILGSVARPIAGLSAAFRLVGQGDLQARAAVESADHLGRLAAGFNDMVEGLRRAETVKSTFGVYVHPRLVEDVLAGKVALGGELRQATVLFADVRGFTSMSERLPAPEVVRFLNAYLDRMVEAIVEAGGTVDKFIGDGIMAGFGVPLAVEDHAFCAVRAGLEMLRRLDAWNAERGAGGEAPVQIGVGLHTGEVVAGSIGSSKKMQYTLIGDTVNTASRLEQLTKDVGVRLVVSEATWRAVEGRVQGRALAPVRLKGKADPVQVYEVTGLD